MNALTRLVLPDVVDLLREGRAAEIADALGNFHSADVADLIEKLDDADARALLLALPAELRVQTFEQLEEPARLRLVEVLGAQAVSIVREMSADDRADLVSALPDEQAQALLEQLPAAEREEIEQLVEYPEYTAGAIMTTDFVVIRPDMSAQQAIEHLRQAPPSRAETIYALYVLDEERRLLGVASLEKLVLAAPETPVTEVMYKNPISLPVDLEQEAVVQALGHYDFLALPVVDGQGRMVGIVTHDDVLDVAMEEADEDAQLLGAVQPLEAPYFETAFLTFVRKRAVWLSVLFVAGLVAGTILREFEETMQRTVALIFFLPLIIASGGNSGAQSATLVIRGLAVGEMRPTDWLRIVRRELGTGLALGTLLGTFGVAVAATWGIPDWQRVAATVWLTLIGIVAVGSLLGGSLPLLMARLGIDPALVSTPLVACLVDILGILIYVLVAGLVIPG